MKTKTRDKEVGLCESWGVEALIRTWMCDARLDIYVRTTTSTPHGFEEDASFDPSVFLFLFRVRVFKL